METYIVRIWRDDEAAEQQAAGRGVVRHVSSGEELPFRTFDQLLEFLRATPAPEQAPVTRQADRPAAAD